MTISAEDARRIADEAARVAVLSRFEEMREISADSAKAAVREMLFRLGVDEEEEGAFAEFRADLQYARRLRKASDTVGTAGLWAIVGLIITGTIGAIWIGFTSLIPH